MKATCKEGHPWREPFISTTTYQVKARPQHNAYVRTETFCKLCRRATNAKYRPKAGAVYRCRECGRSDHNAGSCELIHEWERLNKQSRGTARRGTR